MVDTNYGRHSSEARATYGYVAPGQMRGCTYNADTNNLWLYQLGIWAGKETNQSASNVTARIGVYTTDASKNPDDRMGYSESFTVSTAMISAAGGASHTANLATIDIANPSGATLAAIPLYSGTRYHLAALGTVGYLAHAMQEAALIVKDNEKFYNRTGLSQPPPDPFGAYTSSTEGHMTMWGVCEINVAPDTPSNLSPSGSINDTAPTFSADFNDSNEARGDYMNQYKIQVRRVSDATSFWDTTVTASAAERTADAISKAYGGTTLVRGTAYEWRTQMSDHFGTWSSWTAWTSFTPANLGYVTLDSNPTSKIEDNTPDFEGRWNHQSATTMKTTMVRILAADNTTVLQTGADYDIADVASSAAPGTLFTIAWANTGLTDLAWGTSYYYQIRGYDGTQWSDWSTSRSFSTNAAPTVPANLNPANSQIVTDYPELHCTFTDSDDTTATGLTGKARIKNSGGTVLKTRTMTYDSGNAWWEYQTIAGANEVQSVSISGSPTGGTFTLTFEGQTTAGIAYNATAAAVQSALEALSNIAVGDVSCTVGPLPGTAVTVTFTGDLGLSNRTEMTANSAGLTGGSSPTASVTTTTGGIDGDLATFATYKWDAYSYDGTLYSGDQTVEASATKSSEATFIYAEGPTVSVTAPTDNQVITTANLAVTWTTTDQQKYRVYIYANGTSTVVYDSGEITSTTSSATVPSGYLRDNTEYDLVVWVQNSTPLDGSSATRNFSVNYTEPDAVANFTATAVAITTDLWESAYRLTWDQTTYSTNVWQEYTIRRSAATGLDTASIILARITAPTQVSYIDYIPQSGVVYTYSITQDILTGLDTLTSAAATATPEDAIALGGVVLVSVDNPGSVRVNLKHTRERDHGRDIDEAVYQPLSGAAPTTVRSAAYVKNATFDARLFADDEATAAARRNELVACDESRDTFCYRDDKGRKYFCTLPSVTITDQVDSWYIAAVETRQERYTEGVE